MSVILSPYVCFCKFCVETPKQRFWIHLDVMTVKNCEIRQLILTVIGRDGLHSRTSFGKWIINEIRREIFRTTGTSDRAPGFYRRHFLSRYFCFASMNIWRILRQNWDLVCDKFATCVLYLYRSPPTELYMCKCMVKLKWFRLAFKHQLF